MSQIPTGGLQWITQGSNFYSNFFEVFFGAWGNPGFHSVEDGCIEGVFSGYETEVCLSPVKDSNSSESLR
jgi:hypothetical protein